MSVRPVLFTVGVLSLGVLAGGATALLQAGTAPANVTETKAASSAAFVPAQDNTAGFPSPKAGDFHLVDQFGRTRTSKEPDGRYQLLFFGYAKCKAICSVALPNIAAATDLLDGMGHAITPVLITVDPERDTQTALKQSAPKVHKRLVGLTGDSDALAAAYKAFNISRKFIFDHPEEGAVYTHGSMIYLLAPNGEFKTLFPPITSPVRIAELVSAYIAEDAGG